MKQSFIPLFMRYSKVPPRPNQKVKYDEPTPIDESESLDYKDYPNTEVNGYEHNNFHHPQDNDYEHEHYHHSEDEADDDYLGDKEYMHKPGGNKNMMPMCPLAKAFVCWQSYGKVYSPPEAFRKGTIFPDLHQEYLR